MSGGRWGGEEGEDWWWWSEKKTEENSLLMPCQLRSACGSAGNGGERYGGWRDILHLHRGKQAKSIR